MKKIKYETKGFATIEDMDKWLNGFGREVEIIAYDYSVFNYIVTIKYYV